MIDYINVRCNEWARMVAGRSAKLGYPSQSSIARWLPSNSVTVEIDLSAAEQIDKAVLQLPTELKSVVKAYYLGKGTVLQMAVSLGIHRDTLYARLHQAHLRIQGWLDDRSHRQICR